MSHTVEHHRHWQDLERHLQHAEMAGRRAQSSRASFYTDIRSVKLQMQQQQQQFHPNL
jgi:hypothetical protein